MPILTQVATAINSSTAWCGMRIESLLKPSRKSLVAIASFLKRGSNR